MAIATDSYIDVLDNDSHVVDRIGLSKTLDNYTVEELMAFAYCSNTDKLFRDIRHGLAAGSTVTGVGFTNVTGGIPCIWSRVSNPNYWILRTEQGTGGNQNNPDGLYKVVVWLYGEDPTASNTLDYNNPYYTDLSALKVITQWDAPHYLLDVHSIGMYNTGDFGASGWGNPKTAEAWEISGKTYTLDYHTDLKSEDDEAYNIPTEAGKVIKPYNLFLFDGNIYIKPIIPIASSRSAYGMASTYFTTFNAASTAECSCVMRDAAGNNPIGVNNAIASLYSNTAMSTAITFPYDVRVDNNGTDYGIDANGYKIIYYRQGTSSPSRSVRITYLYDKENDLKLLVAGAGLHFKADKVYKPIINGGHVDGFTDVLTEPSELDDWHDNTDHGITPTPPGPSPGPYDDDPWHGINFSGVGVGGAGAFAKCYYMTSTELANLRSWMNSINVPEGFDPMQQIIGLSQVPVTLSGDAPENVVFINSSAVYDPGVTTRAIDTGVATQQAMGTPISYYLGSVDIVRRMQERGEPYLDYDCQIELYLPLIGMFSLDTQAVMGRTISAYAVLDPVSGTLAAYAYVSKDGQNLPIAYGSTTIGVDLPISAQQLSVSRAALKQANAQLGASLLSGALTMLAAASSGGKSSGSGAKTSTGSSGLSAAGIREAGSDYMKASQVGNIFGDFMQWGRTIRQLSYGNNTAVAGSFGGSTAQWSYPFTPYVKIIRPRYEKPSNYAHSQGVPCVQTKTIGSCTGFIQCIGADVSGITGATDLELQAIQAALSNGIYAGGGS